MPDLDYSIRLGALWGLDELVRELGGSPEHLLAHAKLPVDIRADPEQSVSYAKFENILELGATYCDCPDFGLRLATKQGLEMLGVVGLLMERCASFGDALKLAQTYICTHVLGEYWQVDHYPQQVIITRYQFAHSAPNAKQLKELSIGVCFRLIKTLCGTPFQADFVHFTHHAISSDQRYQNYFGAPVRFNQEQNQIGFSSKFLSQKITSFDPHTRAQLLQQLNQGLARSQGDLVRQVRVLILQSIGSAEHSLDTVAEFLSIHPRTLQRRLKQEGYSYNALLLEMRMSMARWLLQASDMKVTLMSQTLGYSDVSAFSRAFHSAMGHSPRQWRQLRDNDAE